MPDRGSVVGVGGSVEFRSSHQRCAQEGTRGVRKLVAAGSKGARRLPCGLPLTATVGIRDLSLLRSSKLQNRDTRAFFVHGPDRSLRP